MVGENIGIPGKAISVIPGTIDYDDSNNITEILCMWHRYF